MLPLSENGDKSSYNSQTKLNRFLVCGLGSLGQHCVAMLKEYGVVISAIDQEQPKNLQVPNLLSLLDQLLIGDCRLPSILEQAHVCQCRTILLLTGNERVNIEAAFAARILNPRIRLIVRSDKQNLNELLSKSLGNFIAFEPHQLSASSFAIAALGDKSLGYFQLDGYPFRVVKHQVKAHDLWSNHRYVYELNTSYRRVLNHANNSCKLPQEFHQWQTDAILHAEDNIVYIEVADQRTIFQEITTHSQQNLSRLWKEIISGNCWRKFIHRISYIWQRTDHYQSLRIAIIYGITIVVLWCCGTIIYSFNYPQINIVEAFYATAVLLLGGYGDLFGSVKFKTQPEPSEYMPGWLRLFSLGLTLIGTGFVGVLYALLTDTLLSLKFHVFTNYFSSIPEKDYVLLIGLNRVGQKVASLLQEFKQPLVCINNNTMNLSISSTMPLIIGSNITEALEKLNLANSKSIVIVTDDEMENLEIALMAHTYSSISRLIVRTYDRHFSDNVLQLFPYAQVLCTSAISAEVFAAAAFGENILSLFHLDNQSILVVEYLIETGDTLNGLLLAEVVYGYGVVAILYQKSAQSPVKVMPSDDIRLTINARLIVLANSNSLQRIERGEKYTQTWHVQVEKALTQDAIFYGANEISAISGCDISTARQLMRNLPAKLPIPLYKQQAVRLVQKLQKLRVISTLKIEARD